MHKSRLGGLIIDCRTDDLPAAAEFWGQALGLPRVVKDEPGEEHYVYLSTGPNDLDIEVQQVDHASRVHLDIETDDIPAEVDRLVALGAKVVTVMEQWMVLEAPTGQRFCVVSVQTANFDDEANVWP